MSENDQGFSVNDRRIFRPDAPDNFEHKDDEKQTIATEAPPTEEPAKADDDQDLNAAASRKLPPVAFGTFVISLAHAAMLHMGHLEETQGTPRNMDLARHTIDTIAMLKEKTRGNLDQEEQSLLDGILTELRMLYVQTRKG